MTDQNILLNDSSAEVPGGDATPKMLWSRLQIFPKNSGAQMAVTRLFRSELIASSFKLPFRNYALKMVEARKLGMSSISSEGGATWRAITTQRQEMSLSSINKGPSVDGWDKWFYGDKATKNNPQSEGGGDFF